MKWQESIQSKKARKNYKYAGIKKGDTYFWWKFRNSPIRRSKTYPKRQQLTQSNFGNNILDSVNKGDKMTAVCTNYRPPTIEEIRAARKKKVIVAMYTVFGDESHDPKQERVFAVAGVIGTQEEWDALEIKWKDQSKGKIIHSADLESDRGAFEGIPHKQNLQLYRDLVTILSESPLMGYACVMDLDAYNTYFPDTLEYVGYMHCFIRVIEHFGKLISILLPREENHRANFIFDANLKSQHAAFDLFELYRLRKDWEYSQYFGKISADNIESVGIQVADLFTRESMKHGDNHFNKLGRMTRKSFIKLTEGHKFKVDFFERGYWEGYKKAFPDIEKQSGLSRNDYAKWLHENGLADNLPNKTHFFIQINTEDQK